ncbi:MAG: hypothetical protein NTW07_01430, partial [candidate division Zixibacteria bacterium]|nr:hypothetical protein [candidate division Zixibacteria bacterium]
MRTRFSRWQALFTAVVIWGGFCAVSVLAEQGPDTSAHPHGRSVSEFVTPDGRFDLEAARLSGFEGSLDLDGTDLQFDPQTGEPRVRPSTPASLSEDPDDIFWDNSISPSVAGVGGAVIEAIVYDGQLVVGGYFQAAGGVVANGIAAWDGASWSPLGTGMSGGTSYNTPHVNALTVYEGKLIAGGYFTVAGGVAARHIASWDGSSWSPLGSGMGGEYPNVITLTVFDGKLIVGGEFTTAGGVAASRIATWDGSSWSPLGSGMGDGPYPRVYALTVYDGKLIAGGEFTTAGGMVANHIAS